MCIAIVNSKHRKILAGVFRDPVSGTISWSDIESLLVGVGAKVVEGSGSRVRFVKDGIVATCRKVGKDPQKPFSGKVMFRIDPEIHRRAARAAELEGVSLNNWAEQVLDRAAGG